MRAWYSAWADSIRGVRSGLEVEHRPQVGQDVQAVQAQVVRAPAGAEGGGQVPVAGLVDLLHPGVQPGDGFLAVGGRELPPRWRRAGTVSVRVGVGGSGLGELGQGGRVLAQGVADAGDQVGELGELLVVVGELLQRGGDRVVGHGQLQG